jgi:hypothetical protein
MSRAKEIVERKETGQKKLKYPPQHTKLEDIVKFETI